MKQQQFVLPVMCVNCGATFDLWHDLISSGDKEDLVEFKENDTLELERRGLVEKEHFCWKCRQKSMGRKLNQKDTELVEEDNEFELEWE